MQDVKARLTPIALTADAYADYIRLAAEAGLAGEIIYDGLIAHCARVAGALWLYTWNLRHFERVLQGSSVLVRTPNEPDPGQSIA